MNCSVAKILPLQLLRWWRISYKLWTFRFQLSSEGHKHFNRSSKETVLEIVLSESDVGIEREVAELQATELQATELELSSAWLASHVSLMM